MKVVHIVTSISGGAGIATMRLHRALRNNGIESYILQKSDTTDEDKKNGVYTLYESTDLLYRLSRKLGLTPEKKQQKLISTYARNYEYEIATFPTTSYRIDEHPLVKNADIIHLQWIATFLDYNTFFKKISKPVIWTQHDKNAFLGIFHYSIDVEQNPNYLPLENKIQKFKYNIYESVQNLTIVSPSHWLMNAAKNNSSFNKFNHQVIANGINIPDSRTTTLSNSNNYINILFISHGTEIKRKGFQVLKEALELINNEFTSKIYLTSIGGENIPIGNKITHQHIESITNREKLNEIYTSSDITIIPSLEDNLPNVMLESFANGTPVISFSNGGMAEHVHTGETGILIKDMNAVALKNAIEDFINNKYNFDRESIRNYAKKHFDAEKQALKYIELYKQILNS